MHRFGWALVLTAGMMAPGAANAAEPETLGLERWKFLIGNWDLVERRYDFDSKLMQTNHGRATFSHAMNGKRIQELQTVISGTDTTTAIHVFVYDPRSKEIEIARTDSGHHGFWVIIGTMSVGRIDMLEKHPDPESEISRRITYVRANDDQFQRQLEFSRDHGKSWFVRSEWTYTRR